MFPPHIRLKPLALLCNRLAVATGAGLDDRRIWRDEATRGGRSQQTALGQVSDALARGESIAAALERTGDYFPVIMRQIVAVGETSGRLERTYRQLADHYDRLLAARRDLWGRLAWPLLELGLAVLVIGAFIWILGLVPINANSAAGAPAYDPLGWGLVGGRGLIVYLNILICAGIAFLLLALAFKRGGAWVNSLERLALGAPLLGPALRTVALARFAWAMELVLDTPMNLRKALPLALDAAGTSVYSRHAAAVVHDVANGRTIHQALAATGEFPRDMLDAIEVGEQSGMLPETMRRQSQLYQERAKTALGVIAQLIGYVIWLAIAVLIIVLIFRLYGSYVSTIQSLTP